MNVGELIFNVMGDDRGSLVSLEANRNIPFEINRIYYIYGNKNNVHRGFHAHKALKQVLICINGACKIRLDNGRESRVVLLDDPSMGLYINTSLWREMYDFSDGCVLMVVADMLYDESDYIRDYDEFIKYINSDSSAI